jgi:hypothetical protein
MQKENNHAMRYHLSRIADELIEEAVKSSESHPHTETELKNHLDIPSTDNDELTAEYLRQQIQISMRLLLTMQRRSRNFKL